MLDIESTAYTKMNGDIQMKRLFNKKLRLGSVLLVAFVIVLSISAIAAVPIAIQAQLSPNITVTSNGAAQTFRNVNGDIVYPILYEGTTYLPVRAVSRLFGASIDWVGATETVVLTGVDQRPSSPLVGRWQFTSGDFIYYFNSDADIEFFADGSVIEYSDYRFPGEWIPSGDNEFIVHIGFDLLPRVFLYSISGDRLTISDEDGDQAVYTRMAAMEDNNLSRLAGRWNYTTGNYVYFFGIETEVEFFQSGFVVNRSTLTSGRFTLAGEGILIVRASNGENFTFSYALSGDTLTLEDSDGDRAVFARAG